MAHLLPHTHTQTNHGAPAAHRDYSESLFETVAASEEFRMYSTHTVCLASIPPDFLCSTVSVQVEIGLCFKVAVF